MRKVQKAQFEPVEATVELSFQIGEGEQLDDFLDQAARLAQAKVLEMVGLAAAPAPRKATETTAVATDKSKATTSVPTAGKEKGKAELEAENAATIKALADAAKGKPVKPPKAAGGNISKTPEDRKDPAAMDDDDADADALRKSHTVKNGTAPVDSVIDEVLEDDWNTIEGEAEEITDKDLVDRISKHNAKIKNAVAIRTLIGKYVKTPGQAKDITQDKRAAFLLELEAL